MRTFKKETIIGLKFALIDLLELSDAMVIAPFHEC
jgi:hypothetical protein